MWGEQGRKSRGSWRDVDPMPALPGESRIERLKRLKEVRHEYWRGGNKEKGNDGEAAETLLRMAKEKQ